MVYFSAEDEDWSVSNNGGSEHYLPVLSIIQYKRTLKPSTSSDNTSDLMIVSNDEPSSSGIGTKIPPPPGNWSLFPNNQLIN